MLVLTRKSQESVVIGAGEGVHPMIKITVLSIHGDRVRLGFETDSSVPIHRAEIYDRIQTQLSHSVADC
jgi:carbon storage regulator